MSAPRDLSRPARLLFVHAHPDDELLATGVAIVHHVAAGDEVHVLTCTLGEQGEVIPTELQHLDADHEDTLGEYRADELRAAMATVGARSHVLGAEPASGALSRWRDSGMAGTPSAQHPLAWVNADPAEAAAAIAAVIREVDPDVVVTYDQHGGYAHPDHIQTHRMTLLALQGMDPADRPALYGTFTPRSWAEEDREWLIAHPAAREWHQPSGDFPPSVVPDAVVTHAVIDPGAVAGQTAGLRHHRTQVSLDPPHYALSNEIAARLPGREGYAQLDVRSGLPIAGPHQGEERPGLLDRAPAAVR